jgi:hypothetical protein
MGTILHRIKAHLYENFLTKNDPGDYIARVASERTLNVKQVCETAVARGGADIPAPAMEHAVTLWLKEMSYQLCDGFSINTGYFTARALIRGIFHSIREHFNPDKHAILFAFFQGPELRKELSSVEIEILGPADAAFYILQVTDVKTGSVDDLLTPNRNLRIAGERIKITGDSEASSICFINQATGERTKVDDMDIVANNPSELLIVTPGLAAGAYRLEITTRFSGSHPLKEPRTTVFDKILTVVPTVA